MTEHEQIPEQLHKRPLVILTGPTAAGKTKLSLRLAKTIEGEIISADSMQIYRHMDIGSAKIRPEEMQGIPHYLVDVLSPFEPFDVYRFKEMASEAVGNILQNGHIPILVGGTGFYIQALLYDVQFAESENDDAYRMELSKIAQNKGNRYLHDMLRAVDEESADAIHENNVKRVIRALEYYRETGEKISAHNKKQHENGSPYNFCYFVLTDDRKKLYERIDKRVDRMMEQGLLQEVQQLKDMGASPDMVSMKGLGYKEILAHLNGEISLEEAVYIIKRDTRHFAKRQLTWFRREKDVIWLDRGTFASEDDILKFMLAQLQKKQII